MRGIDRLFVSFGFIVAAVVTVNILIVLFVTNPTQQTRTISAAGLMESVKILNRAAIIQCASAAKQQLLVEPGEPTDAVSDGRSVATVTWQANAAVAGTLVCNYHEGTGVTRLTLDDRVMFAAPTRPE
ncbi:MAG: hypothetical protein ACREWG_01285 [Gammaproteobacteria bacterium]